MCLGRAQYRHRLWQTIQENILIIGRSRSGKSGWLARVIVHFRGAVVSATTKPDLFLRTSGLRARWGRPVDTFDPQGIGGARTRSTIRFDPVPGCEVPAVAMRRGTALTDAVRTKGTEGGDFWNEQAATQMPALLSAAALHDLDLRSVRRWTLSGDTRDAGADPAGARAPGLGGLAGADARARRQDRGDRPHGAELGHEVHG